MCVMSMVHDHFAPKFPDLGTGGSTTDLAKLFGPKTDAELDALKAELRQLIADFKEARAAAAKVDELTGQADCVDPKKATLEERVSRLEREVGIGR